MFAEPHPGNFRDEQFYVDTDYLRYHLKDLSDRFSFMSNITEVKNLLKANDIIMARIGNRRGFAAIGDVFPEGDDSDDSDFEDRK